MRHVLRRFGAGVAPGMPVDAAPAATAHPGVASREVEFSGYAEDCRILGFWRYDAERMSDALNECEAYPLRDVLVAALEDGRATAAPELLVRRDELLAVRAADGRGNPGRRTRVRPAPITLQTGPYTIHGYIHGPPGANALLHIRRRRPMVALTEAWMEYRAGGEDHRGRVGTIVVNQEILDWVRPSRDEEVHLPDLPAEKALDPHAKDLTGYILTWHE